MEMAVHSLLHEDPAVEGIGGGLHRYDLGGSAKPRGVAHLEVHQHVGETVLDEGARCGGRIGTQHAERVVLFPHGLGHAHIALWYIGSCSHRNTTGTIENGLIAVRHQRNGGNDYRRG